MADKKISALTAATTPLAGTEVLPIVQSGATVKVSVASLTAGRAVSVAGLSSTAQIKGIGLSADYFSPQLRATSNDSLATGQDLLIGVNTTADKGYIQSVHWGTGYTQLLLNPSGGDVGIGNGNLVIGTAGKGIDFSGGVLWRTGTGSPEGVVTASVGSMYTNVAGGAGTTLYVKESGVGNTGWVAK